MVKVSEMPPDERLAYEARLRETFDRVAAVNERLAHREAERMASGVELAERHAERMREREDREKAAAHIPPVVQKPAARTEMDPETAAGWNRWAEMIVNRKINAFSDKVIGPLAEEIGDFCGRDARRIDKLEESTTRDGVATVELLRELEARIAALEKRADDAEKRADDAAEARRVELAKPRLLGFVGARHDAA